MTRPALFSFAVVVAFGGVALPARAIEMFTNFNNGTELGTRPLGIEIMSPVRYHAYPHGRWFHGPVGGCDTSASFDTIPAAPVAATADRPASPRKTTAKPVVIEPDGVDST